MTLLIEETATKISKPANGMEPSPNRQPKDTVAQCFIQSKIGISEGLMASPMATNQKFFAFSRALKVEQESNNANASEGNQTFNFFKLLRN